MLTGLQLEEEHLPAFVENLCFCPTVISATPNVIKGFPATTNSIKINTGLQNVTVKMETPVLYFYSSELKVKPINVQVMFNRGAISQWYPSRSDGESYGGNVYLSAPGPYQLAPSPSPELFNIDFAIQRQGWIQWQAFIFPLNADLKYTNDPSMETPAWASPRATASNLIKTRGSSGQVEKFLFYRGIGNFSEPLKVEFNVHRHLVISNLGTDALDYVMVYEKQGDGKTVVWWSGDIDGNSKKIAVKPAIESSNISSEMENFVRHLISAGLYRDEAQAMLNTWKTSYFEREGLKVFWIVPTDFTNSTLPLQITPQPRSIKRVLVGRSEILTPEFEQELSTCRV